MKKLFSYIVISTILSLWLMGCDANNQNEIETPVNLKISNTLTSIGESDVAYIELNQTKLGIITHEFLAPMKESPENDKGEKLFIVYLAENGKINFSKGYTLDGGSVTWNYSGDIPTYTRQKGDKQAIYLSKEGKITTDNIGETKDASFSALMLNDKRGTETISYPIVKIGQYFWIKKNLATKLFNDGTSIPFYTNQKEWMKLTTPSCAVYKNDAKPDENENIKTYGVLYNFYAAANEKIAPEKWFVPTDNTFAHLVAYIDSKGYDPEATDGMEAANAGTALKSKTGWRDKHLDTTNADPVPGNDLSGFSAIGAGSTSDSKYFEFSGDEKQAYFWTTTPYEEKKSMMRRLYWDSAVSNRWFAEQHMGFSIRIYTPLSTFEQVDN